MTKRTEINKTSVVILLVLVLSSSLLKSGLARASDVDVARSAQDEANARFFEEILKLPDPSVTDLKRLKSEIVSPAVKNVNDALEKEREADFKMPDAKTMFRASTAAEAKKKAARRSRIMKQINAALAVKQALSTGAGTTGAPASGGEQDSGPARPETVLDGSGIKRELEFGGKPKVAPAKPAKPAWPLGTGK
jgi:hypothetical protein